MVQRNLLQLRAFDEPFEVVVEPWANEFMIRTGDRCELVALHPETIPPFLVELVRGKLVVWVEVSGATFEFWRGGVLELAMPVRTP